MILVTVGLHVAPFERLVCAADDMAALTCEPVLIQRGVARHVPAHAAWFDVVSAGEMVALIAQARVLVSHAGAGSILTARRAGVPLVLVPRLQCLGEAIDDHQLQLADALAVREWAIVVTNPSPSALMSAVERAVYSPELVTGTGLHEALRRWLTQMPVRSAPRWWTCSQGG